MKIRVYVQYGTVQAIDLAENHSGWCDLTAQIMMCVGCKSKVSVEQRDQRASL